MQQTAKPNFVQQMRKRLNAYHIEKLKRIQQNQKYKEHFLEQNKVKDALMQFDQSEHHMDEHSGIDQITGWNSTRPTVIEDNQLSTFRQNMTLKNNLITSIPSKTLGFQFEKKPRNPDMINYLKSLLSRLQSPLASKRCLKTQSQKRKNQYNTKSRTNQIIQKIKKQKLNLLQIKNNQKPVSQPRQLKLQRNQKSQRCSQRREPQLQPQVQIQIQPQNQVQGQTQQIINKQKFQKTKFQVIDLNTQNNPFATHTVRATSQYKKIKRPNNNRNNCQYEIDIAHEKDILQQLIRGGSVNRATTGKTYKSSQKFTLKNLLC